MNRPSNLCARRLGWVLAGLLLVAPAALASEEDAREQGAAAKTGTGTGAGTKGSATKPDCAVLGKAVAGAEGAAPQCSEKKATDVDPSFNTIEEVVAYRGAVASLWAARTSPAPAVEWRAADTEKPELR